MLKRTSLLLGVLCLTIFHVGYRNATRSDPPGVDDLQIIGIALTANYATVTRRCNGTFQDLGRIEAQDEYVEMIQRMSTWDAAHLTYVYSRPPTQQLPYPLAYCFYQSSIWQHARPMGRLATPDYPFCAKENRPPCVFRRGHHIQIGHRHLGPGSRV